ncbi:MAG TPA: DNA-directed RNA polymerase subunit beta, partial [Kiritimatiellia bacterium]|nr:DNA-directed RNA polymerase subunit beta [Kiritimatiellia bacterium]
MVDRINFGKLTDVVELPDLIEIQTRSYLEFLQMDVAPTKRRLVGLQAVFKEVFPIESYDGNCSLDFVKYEITPPKQTAFASLKEGESHTAALHVTFRLRNQQEVREETVFMGEVPLITEQGTFIINGAERVIVSQLHRSPGICFEQTLHANGTLLHSFRVIPDRGSWVEVQFDTSDMLNIYLDRKKRRRKFLATTFLRALGYGTDEELLGLFYKIEKLDVAKPRAEQLDNRVFLADVLDDTRVIVKKFEPVTRDMLNEVKSAGIATVDVVDVTWDEGLLLKSMRKDQTASTDDALKD